MSKIKKRIIYLVLFSLLIIIIFIFYKYVFLTSYLSVLTRCAPEVREKIGFDNYVIGGTFSRNETMYIIKIFEDKKNKVKYNRILKHELCHLKQDTMNRRNDCEYYFIPALGDEIECHTVQYFPDTIYTFFYYDINKTI